MPLGPRRSEFTRKLCAISLPLSLLFVASPRPPWPSINARQPTGKLFSRTCRAPGQGGKIEVTPASGQGVSTPGTQAAAATGAPAQTETERLQQLSKKYRDTSRLDALQSREIPGLRNYLDRQKNRCDAQVAALRSKQGSAKNNLAGATYLQSIAVEMSTVATQCDTDVRLGSARLQDLLKEESALKTALGK